MAQNIKFWERFDDQISDIRKSLPCIIIPFSTQEICSKFFSVLRLVKAYGTEIVVNHSQLKKVIYIEFARCHTYIFRMMFWVENMEKWNIIPWRL